MNRRPIFSGLVAVILHDVSSYRGSSSMGDRQNRTDLANSRPAASLRKPQAPLDSWSKTAIMHMPEGSARIIRSFGKLHTCHRVALMPRKHVTARGVGADTPYWSREGEGGLEMTGDAHVPESRGTNGLLKARRGQRPGCCDSEYRTPIPQTLLGTSISRDFVA